MTGYHPTLARASMDPDDEEPSGPLPESQPSRHGPAFTSPHDWYAYCHGSGVFGIKMPEGSTLQDRVIAYTIHEALERWTPPRPPTPPFGDNWV